MHLQIPGKGVELGLEIVRGEAPWAVQVPIVPRKESPNGDSLVTHLGSCLLSVGNSYSNLVYKYRALSPV
jgi:hypothetical protein